MGSVMDRLQPFDSDVCVELSRCERSVTKEFLDGAQVRSPFQEMCGRGVTKAVWPDVGRVGYRTHYIVNNPPGGTGIQTTTSRPEEQRGRSTLVDQRGSSLIHPTSYCAFGRNAEWHRAFATALAQNSNHPQGVVDIVKVETAQLGDSNARCVEQLHHGLVTQRNRIASLSFEIRDRHGGFGLFRTQHRGQRPVRPRSRKSRSWVLRQKSRAVRPGGEHPSRCRTAGHRRPARPGGQLRRQPGPQRCQIDRFDGRVSRCPARHVSQQSHHVTQVRPHRVRRQAPLHRQVALVPVQCSRDVDGELVA